MALKVRHFINLHKAFTPFVVYGLMAFFNKFQTPGMVYLGLHGTYGLCWLLKEAIFPDKVFDRPVGVGRFIFNFTMLSGYWSGAYFAVTKTSSTSLWTIVASIFLFTMGMFFHIGADSQKYFTLKVKSGLINDGFFSIVRHPNYLGEVLTYTGFNLLSGHWVPHAFFAFIFVMLFIPSMKKKEASLARYDEWQEYSAKTAKLIPFLL